MILPCIRNITMPIFVGYWDQKIFILILVTKSEAVQCVQIGCVSHSDILKTKMIIFNTSIVVTQMTYLDYKFVLKEKNCLKVIKSNLVNAKIPLLSTYCLKICEKNYYMVHLPMADGSYNLCVHVN